MDDLQIRGTRLDSEPVLMRGCSYSEISWVAGVSALVLIPTCVIMSVIVGGLAMWLGLALIGTLFSTLILTLVLQRAKRGRPSHYYQTAARVALHRRGLASAPWVLRSGVWDIGRSM
ncbi:MAG: TIGR03750 family conjugal transfer protein [Gammaproteobacteria bacterium]|nr:TIGR03750 family conjugal transfer protein [Gammaproteobacteria bacterium]